MTPADLASLDARFGAALSAPRWWLAFSGGMDSTVLLHLLVDFLRRQTGSVPSLQALHVNHGIHVDAGLWADHCRRVCDDLNLPITVVTVQPVQAGSGNSLEMAAREARYAAFLQHIGEGDVLWMAHHQDDQAETLMLRLLRGSGVEGLAGMPDQRALGQGELRRPLLSWPRSVLRHWAEAQSLRWIDDPSNARDDTDRNWLRLRVLPLLEQRWPSYRQTLSRTAVLLRETRTVENTSLDAELETVSGQDRYGPWLSVAALPVDAAQRRHWLRRWLARLGFLMPSQAHLDSLDTGVVTAREDAVGSWLWQGKVFSRYRQRLYCHDESPAALPHLAWAQPGCGLALPDGSSLQWRMVQGGGLRVREGLQLRYRQGGERCRPAGRAHSQTLKRLMQEYAIPPWLRDRVPLLYQGDVLVAVGDYWVCAESAAGSDEEGWQLDWQLPAFSLS